MSRARTRSCSPLAWAATLGLLLFATACSDSSTAADAAVADARARDGQITDQRSGDTLKSDGAKDIALGDAPPKTDGSKTDGSKHDGTTADTLAIDSLAPDTVSPDLPTSGCNAAKIAFTQANPQMYEIYEFCFEAGATLTETQAKVIDPGLLCLHTGGGAFAKCASGKWRCSGILDRGPTGAVMQASWDMICLISQLPKIDTIVGGHYL